MKARNFLVLISLFFLLPSLVSAQGGWITLPGHTFIPRHENLQWNNVTSWGAASYLYGVGSPTPNFLAPVVFPQEADGLSVRQFNATVGDFDAVGEVWIALIRMNRYSGVTQKVFELDTGVADTPGKTVITDTSGAYRLIDSQKYAWYVHVGFHTATADSKLRLYAVRIQYQ